MFRSTSLIVVLLALTAAGCDDHAASKAPSERGGGGQPNARSQLDSERDEKSQSELEEQLSTYEVFITDPPRIEDLTQSRPFARPTDGQTTLIEFLGGEAKIERIAIGVVANESHGELNESIVRKRVAKSVCMDMRKDRWSYAPFATGTVYFRGGGQQSFALLISGISIAGHLFAELEGSEKPQSEAKGSSR